MQDTPHHLSGILECLIANALILVIVAGLSFSVDRADITVVSGGQVLEGLEGLKYSLSSTVFQDRALGGKTRGGRNCPNTECLRSDPEYNESTFVGHRRMVLFDISQFL